MRDNEHFLRLKELVLLEEREEFEALRSEFQSLSASEREVRGKALLNLTLDERHWSGAGHALATFSLPGRAPLPIFTLEPGDTVSLVAQPPVSDDIPWGTVYEKSLDSITVAFTDELPEFESSTFELHRSVNRLTYRRMLETLDALAQTQNTRLAELRDISLSTRKARSEDAEPEIRWFDPGLNRAQKEAVRKSLLAKDFSLVHGPPGTGKTTALVEIVRQALARHESVFVTAPSNTACDNLLERLIEMGVNALRLGHPARVGAHLREHTLDFKLALHPMAEEAEKVEVALARLKNRMTRYRERRSPGRDEEKELRQEISLLKQESKNIRRELYRRVMKEAEAIVGTPTGVQDRSIRDRHFDWVVIDEATQATEPIAWIPIMPAQKVVMAGDHFQLPPTVRSKEAAARGLGVTLFERLHRTLPEEYKTLLDRQYRMHKTIMGFSSKMFYENRLVADESVAARTLADLKQVEDRPETREALLYIDTAGKGFEEKLEPGSESRYNPEEAALVLTELQKMLEWGVPPSEIAVISPYSAQVRYLRSRFPSAEVEIDSVDGFQGREKELVIVSLVRSNLSGELGFLNDTRRMNVAMTRARRKLIMIGDSSTLSSLGFYKSFVEYAESMGAYKTIWEML